MPPLIQIRSRSCHVFFSYVKDINILIHIYVYVYTYGDIYIYIYIYIYICIMFNDV